MNFAKYTNTYPYPSKADFTSTYYYKEGKLVAVSKISALEHLIPEIALKDCVKEAVFDFKSFQETRNTYHSNGNTLRTQFKEDLAEDLGLTNHPKWDKLYQYASEDSDSFGDTYDIALELADLLN